MKKLWLKQDAFNAINSRIKTIECRLDYGFIKCIHKNEILEICNKDNSFIVKINKITRYNNFSEMLDNIDITKLIYNDIDSREKIIDLYNSLYSAKNQRRYNVLCLFLEKI